jgi:RNA polymerase sigma factor (sigma-70 family)
MTQLKLTENYLQTDRRKEQCQNRVRQPAEPLTSREKTVLKLIAAGLSNREIANEMKVTVNTVKTHVSRILTKLGVRSRVQAFAKAREADLL